MRIGVFLGGFTPDVGGGYTFQADVFREFARLIERKTDDYVVLCESPAIAEFVNEMELSCKPRTVVVPRAGLLERLRGALRRELPSLFRRLGRVERAARQASVDLVWFVSGGFFEAMDLPYIATVWDLQHRSHPWFPEVSAGGNWDVRERMLHSFLRRATFVIVGTDSGMQEVQSFYQIPAQRIRKLPHPTPSFALTAGAAAKTDSAILRKYGLTPGYVFYPAQFWPHKNHATLVLALETLRDKHGMTPTLVFVGSDKGNRAHVEALAKQHGVDSQLRFPGFIPQEDLVGLYQHAMAMVYPSFCGPENLPPLEAFALGCPVIAADIPGAREQLGSAGLLVDPGVPELFADAINRISTDVTLREDLRQRGRQRAVSWTGREFAAGVFALFEEFEHVRRAWGRDGTA